MNCRRRATSALLLSLVVPGAALAAEDDGAASARAAAPAEAAAPETSAPDGEAPREATRPSPAEVVRRTGVAFGGEVQVMALTRGDAAARRTDEDLAAAFAEISRVAALVDPAHEGSDVARLNKSAGDAPVVVSTEVFGLLQEAKRVAGLSRGAFDPTLAPAFAAWAFTSEAEAPPTPPSDEDLAARRALVNHKDLLLDAAKRTAALKRPGQAVLLDGVAKGYALERAAAVLEERGVKDFVIAAGGDVVVRGAHGDRPWRVGIQDPRAPGHFAATTVKGGAVMTTADYERFFHDGETRYHHVLDPSTGRPAAGARSVTVFAEDATTAEALSTAVFVLGPKKGLALAQRLKGVEAVIVTSDNRVLFTRGLKGELTWRPPTDAP